MDQRVGHLLVKKARMESREAGITRGTYAGQNSMID
jgi:hypothetical protein